MNTIHKAKNYHLLWADETQTILQLDIVGQWRWSEAYEALSRVDAQLKMKNHWVYTIYNFYPNVRTIPTGNPLTHLSKLVQQEQANERFLIFVRASLFLTQLLSVSGVIGRDSNVGKMKFAWTMEEAFTLIAEDKKILVPYEPEPES